MKLDRIEDLFEHCLQDLLSAEEQITESLPEMAKFAKTPELKEGFKIHLEETKEQIKRLEMILEESGLKKGRMKCKGMEGLLKEGSEVMEAEGKKEMLEKALISGAEKVEHYEIVGYKSAIMIAEELGNTNAVKLLKASLKEEQLTAKKLEELSK
jgi:ferritin-like metal-binding protein YciE